MVSCVDRHVDPRSALDVVMNNATSMQKFNCGEKRAKPLFCVDFGDLDRDQTRMIRPVISQFSLEPVTLTGMMSYMVTRAYESETTKE